MKPLWKMTDKELRRVERECADEERARDAGEELRGRRRFCAEQDDTPSIEWNGFDHPGDY